MLKKIILNENKAGKNMNLGKKLLMQNGMTQDQALQIIGGLKHDMPNSRLADQKFMLGLCRMFLNHELDADTILRVNQMLKYIASDAHINEYDNNLNNLSAQDIISRFEGIRTQSIEQEKETLNNKQYQQSNYQIVRIPDFDTSSQYGDYVDWCVTQDEEMYDNYTNNGEGIFYFCLQNGFENVPRQEDNNCPLDEYGLSMIAVSVDFDGSPNTITCRWNHANNGNDNIMTPEQVSDIIGMSFYQAFPPRLTEEERQKVFQEKLQLFYDAMMWREETMEYYYNDEDELTPYDDENDFEYSPDGRTTYQVKITHLVNGYKLVQITDYDDVSQAMVFDSRNKPLFTKMYHSIENVGENFILCYPKDSYGGATLYNLQENKPQIQEKIYSMRKMIWGNSDCTIYEYATDNNNHNLFDSSTGELLLPTNLKINNMQSIAYTSEYLIEINNNNELSTNIFNTITKRFILPNLKLSDEICVFIQSDGVVYHSNQFIDLSDNMRFGLFYYREGYKTSNLLVLYDPTSKIPLLQNTKFGFQQYNYYHKGIRYFGTMNSQEHLDNVEQFFQNYQKQQMMENLKHHLKENINKKKNIFNKLQEAYLKQNELNESLDHSNNYLYHFTAFKTLLDILSANTFQLSDDSWGGDSHQNFDIYPCYMSLTRNKDARQGYSQNFYDNTRITFDVNKLKQIPDSKLISHSYFSQLGKSAKQKAIRRIQSHSNALRSKGKNLTNDIYTNLNSIVENETRFVSKYSTIPNINDYIVSIDILVQNDEVVSQILDNLTHSIFYPKIHIFTDKSAYDMQDYSKDLDIMELSNFKNIFKDNEYKTLNELYEGIENKPKTVEEYNSIAKQVFGTTYSFNACGYILTDGSLLDFSGYKFGSGQRNYRQQDHRDIYLMGWDADGDTKYFDMDMTTFVNLGNIRLKATSPGFDLSKEPTKQQYSTLSLFISKYRNYEDDGYFFIDISNENGDILYSIIYIKPVVSRVLQDLKNYFDKGIVPQGDEQDEWHPTIKNYDIYENVEDDEYTIGSEGEVGDRNMNYSHIVEEGFSSHNYETEIDKIAKELYRICHKSNDNKCHKQFLINDVLMQFNITINNVKQIGGGFYDTAYGLPTVNINMHENTSVNELFELLMHEITHALDSEIKKNKKYKNYNHKYSIIPETLNEDIREILYMLWDTSERNAWQTSAYDKDVDINYFYNNVTEYLSKFEQEIDEDTLERLRDYFARTIDLKWTHATLNKVKKYFIITSKKQLKKFVTKFKNMQKQLNENSEMEMKAYHGSGTKFKKFDSSFNGSGEGSHSFGPGHYFTSSKNIGKDYANEHGTSQEEIGKFSYNGETDPYIVIRRIKNLLYNLSNQDDVEKLQKIAKNMYFSSDNSDQLIRKICMFAVRMWKQRDLDYEQDYDDYYKNSLEHYRQKLKKEIKDVNNRTLYQVELPEADKFANWEMTVPNKWLDLLYSCLESKPKLLSKLKDIIESYINKDGKLTIGTLYYSLDNMHYDATLGHHLFKTLLKRYGYVGVKYPAGLNFQTSSTKKGDMNYTVFDDNNIKITNKWDL